MDIGFIKGTIGLFTTTNRGFMQYFRQRRICSTSLGEGSEEVKGTKGCRPKTWLISFAIIALLAGNSVSASSNHDLLVEKYYQALEYIDGHSHNVRGLIISDKTHPAHRRTVTLAPISSPWENLPADATYEGRLFGISVEINV